jgi:ankyrin repeat protein
MSEESSENIFYLNSDANIDNTIFPDYWIKSCEDNSEYIPCHKNILIANFEYFKIIFNTKNINKYSGFVESFPEKNKLTLNYTNIQLKLLIRLIYHNQTKFTFNEIYTLLPLLHYLNYTNINKITNNKLLIHEIIKYTLINENNHILQLLQNLPIKEKDFIFVVFLLSNLSDDYVWNILIDYLNIDINERTYGNISILLCCVYKKRLGLFSRLLAAGADPAAYDDNGDTPLIISCKYAMIDYIDILVGSEVNINVDFRNAYNQNALYFLVYYSKNKFLSEEDGSSAAVGRAIQSTSTRSFSNQELNSEDIVNIFTGRFVDYFDVEFDSNIIKCIKFLLEYGASTELEIGAGNRLLNMAILYSYKNPLVYIRIINLLLFFKHKSTASTHTTATTANTIFSENTLHIQTNPNLVDRAGNTALISLAYTNIHSTYKLQILKSLILAGADIFWKNSQHLNYIELENNIQVLRVLFTNIYKDIPNFNINQLDSEGETLLIQATKANCFIKISILLNAGADVNAPDSLGNTPIFYAIMNSRIGTHNLFCINSSERYSRVIDILLKSGADMNILNNNGNSAGDIASLQASV